MDICLDLDPRFKSACFFTIKKFNNVNGCCMLLCYNIELYQSIEFIKLYDL